MGTVTSAARPASSAAGATVRHAAHSDAARVAGRVGLVARGVIYLLLGLLAARVAVGAPSESTDKQGVIALIADQPFGRALLIVLALGMAAYAVWQLVRILQVDEDSDAKTWAKRAGCLGTAVIYGSAAVAAATVVLGDSASGGGGQEEQAWTARVMGWPGGRLLVGAVGLALIGYAGWNAYRAVARTFTKHLETERMSPRWETTAIAAGVAGYLGRGVAFAAIGWFVTKAAVEFDPNEPIGLDGSLRTLQDAAYGPALIVVLALGLALFGLYSFVEARWREEL